MEFEFRCDACGEIHKGMPGFGADAPLSYYVIPEAERLTRCELGSDDCVIDRHSFFVRGCLEIPVQGVDEPLVWGVWVSLSEQSFPNMAGSFRSAASFGKWTVLWLVERLAQAISGYNEFEDTSPSPRPRRTTSDRA